MPGPHRRRNPRAPRRAAGCCRGKKARRCPKASASHARRQHLQVLRRRGPAPARRQAGLGQAGHRDRRDARTRGHGRHHRALELPDRHSRLENRARAGLWQHSRVQARRTGAWLRLGAGRDHQPGRAAGGRLQPGDGSRLTGGSGPAGRPPHRRHLLHRFGRHGPARGAGRRNNMAKAQLEMGGKNPMWCWTTPTWTWQWSARCKARSIPRGSAARHRAGSSSSKASTRASCRSCGTARPQDRPRAGSRNRHRPVASRDQLEQNLRYVDIGRQEGARLLCGGGELQLGTPGHYMAPAIFADCDNAMRICREEIRAGRGGHAGTRLRTRAGPCQRHGIRPASGICSTSRTCSTSSGMRRPAW